MTAPVGWAARLLARTLLTLALRREDREFLRGDLEEEAASRRRRDGWRGDLWYLGQAVRSAVGRSWPGRRGRRSDRHGCGARARGIAGFRHDIRYSVRVIRQQPGFSAAAVLILGLGIGGTVTMFSFVNAMLLKPMPYADAERLVQLHEITPGGYRNPASYPDFADWRDRASSFSAMAAHQAASLNLAAAGEPMRVSGLLATGELFEVLGVPPSHGRTLGPADARVDAERVAVISHSLWQGQLGGRAGIVGDEIFLHGRPTTVVGIMPRGFHYPEYSQVWLPLRLDPAEQSRGSHYLSVVARLADGASAEGAAAELAVVARQVAAENPEVKQGWSAGLMSLREARVGESGTALLVFTGVVLFVLLIATVNVGSLALARGAARRKEIAVRSALGAARSRLVRQLLTESLILAAAGSGVGLLSGRWGRDLLLASVPVEMPLWVDPSFDWRIWASVAVIGVLAGLMLGLLPALRVSRDLGDVLKHGTDRPGGAPRQRLRGGLVVAQVALASMLLIGAGLMMKGFAQVRQVDTGVDVDGVLAFRVSLPAAQYGEDADRREFYRRLVERLGALPRVDTVGGNAGLPLWGAASTRTFYPEGTVREPGERLRSSVYNVVMGRYLETLGIPLLRGRRLTAEDGDPGATPVALVSRSYADLHWPGGGALGHRIRWSVGDRTGPWLTIVGVVDDVRHFGPAADARSGVYVPFGIDPWSSMYLAVRSAAGEPMELVDAARAVVHDLDPRLPVQQVMSMREVWRNSMWEAVVYSWLFVVFSGIALGLAAVGLYGLLAYSVGRRTHEIGVRMALGARRGELLGMVLRQALLLVLVGVALGLVGAFLLSGALSTLIDGVSATDPSVYVLVCLAVLGVAVVSAAIPGRRATRVDPMEALRVE